jgi:hypothetical protein
VVYLGQRTEIARHGRRAEDGRDGKDASRTRRENFQGHKDKQRTGIFLLTSVCFWGMIWPVETIDASAVQEMNL